MVYGLKDDEDWEDEANWYKVNPSLGCTVDIERLRVVFMMSAACWFSEDREMLILSVIGLTSVFWKIIIRDI